MILLDFCLSGVWGDERCKDKTSFGLGLALLHLCVVIVRCGIVVYRVSFPCLDYRILPYRGDSLAPAYFLLFSPYRSLDRLFPYPRLAWRRAKTSFGLGCVLLDFCFFCVFVPLILSGVMPGRSTKQR